MSPRPCAIVVIIAVVVSIRCTISAIPRYPLPVSINKIIDAKLTCDSAVINATISLQHPFKGLLFAKDFAHECSTIGTLANSVTISLPTSGCGVRLSSRLSASPSPQMLYSFTLVAQQDRFLRQIADQEHRFECLLDEQAFLIKTPTSRAGKSMRPDGAGARAWMEVGPDDAASSRLQVGELARLVVKSTLPVGVGWRVVECSARDGLGDSSQKLLDEEGCPVEEGLMPAFRFGPVRPMAALKHQEAVATFAAFKFPDRDRLHLACRMQLCRGSCPKADCGAGNGSLARDGRQLGELLDELEVFNSVEVLAPSIDDFGGRERNRDPMRLRQLLGGERSFCVSPDKLAVTFCILGIIFLCAVLVSACALMKSRRNGNESIFYTRSLFSSSSGGSAFGSKLLLHDSPCMGHTAPRAPPYGRIL